MSDSRDQYGYPLGIHAKDDRVFNAVTKAAVFLLIMRIAWIGFKAIR